MSGRGATLSRAISHSTGFSAIAPNLMAGPYATRSRSGGSLRVIGRPALPNHGHLDLTRVLELLLDVPGDLVREHRRGVVVDLVRLHDDPQLASCVHRI